VLRVLWLNWRDIKHPEAGGAEVFTHEVMRRLAKRGYHMTLFTERFPNSLETEYLDGVRIVRQGSRYTVYNKARKYYKEYKSDYDIVIDEINDRPFLTPKFVKSKPILALSHHISLKTWTHEVPFPLDYIGYYFFQARGLSCYKTIPTVTVSKSSKENLERKFGFRRVFVVPEGLSITPLDDIHQKELVPTIIFLGRLKRNKLPHHAIQAFNIIKKYMADAKMWVLGKGYMLKELEKMSGKDVTFFGHVNEDVKYRLLSKAHLTLVPGIHEGWGLAITESNAVGTPAIAYNIPGLRDSVRDGETGILVEKNSPSSLAQASISLLKDEELLRKYSTNALAFSKHFSWDNTANEFDKIIKALIDTGKATPPTKLL
jgi:glycosyltransferase involved in cell wall biosynthesis